MRQTRGNCSRTKQISHHSPMATASDANFVQSAPKVELSLDQAVNLRYCESCEFHIISLGQV